MCKFTKLKFYKNKGVSKIKLPIDRFKIVQIPSNNNNFEYIIRNEAYDNFKYKSNFCAALTLVFNKKKFDNIINIDQYFNDLEFKLKEFIYKRKGKVILYYRVEKENLRETLFFVNEETAMLLKIPDIYHLFNSSSNIEITLQKDHNWETASKYISLY